jgi:predicted esterase
VIIGCPDYKALVSQRAGNKEKDKRLPKLFLDLVAKLDPKLENVSRKEVLILKGDEDELVPWSASQEFVGRLPNERKEVVGFPGVGHKFTDQMMAKAVSWIVEWRERH